jgi:hypothetical protein
MWTMFPNSPWLQLGLGTGLPALLVLLVAQRRLWRAMIGWLLLPLVILLAALLREMVMQADQATAGAAFIKAAQFLFPPLIIIWGILSVVGFAMGFVLRNVFRPQATAFVQPASIAPSPPVQDRIPGPRPDRMQNGGVQVDFLPLEWGGNGRWIYGPRVTAIATGAILLDLWNTDADAIATFPAQGVVRLDVFLYANRHSYLVTIDYPHQSYRIDDRTQGNVRRIEGRLEDLPLAFDKANFPLPSIAAQPYAPQLTQNVTHRFAAWRSAVLILVCALSVIGTIAVVARNAANQGLTVTPLSPMPRPLE